MQASRETALEHKPRERLMVVLDWESLNLRPKQLLDVNLRVLEIIRERLGSCWGRTLYRIYLKKGDTESKAWYEHYRSEHLIAAWRTPKNRGLRPPADWDFRIRQNILDWCVNDATAMPDRTALVLVSGGGKFVEMVDRLDREGVQLLLIHTEDVGDGVDALKRAYGPNRCVGLELKAERV